MICVVKLTFTSSYFSLFIAIGIDISCHLANLLVNTVLRVDGRRVTVCKNRAALSQQFLTCSYVINEEVAVYSIYIQLEGDKRITVSTYPFVKEIY